MHASMPPESPPPDDERRPSSSSEGGNVVDPAVLAERRAQRAEQAEQSAARRATDAQVLAAQLARERARLEAERDAARAEAAAAREGADAAIAEARHLQAERDTLREALTQARRERDALKATREEAASAAPAPTVEPAPPVEPATGTQQATTESTATNGTAHNGHATPPAAWAAALRGELAVARATVAIVAPTTPAVRRDRPPVVPGLARERQLVARRAAAGRVATASPAVDVEGQRRGDRAAPITALALERERSSRLQAQLDSSLAVQRELRTHIAALQRAIHQRVEAERRIEIALRRVREELTAANTLTAGRAAPESAPSAISLAQAPPAGAEPPAAAPAPPAGPPRAAAGSAAPSAMPMPPAPAPPAASEPPASEAPAAPQASAAAAMPPSAAPPAPSAAPSGPSAAALSREPAGPPRPVAAALDPQRLSAAHERLRAAAPQAPPQEPAWPAGPPAPWVTAVLQRLLASEPEVAGRIAVGLAPAYGLAAQRPLRYDLVLTGHGCLAVDVAPGEPATVLQRAAPRPRGERDLSIAGDAVGVARLLHGRRALLRWPARVRGGRRALRELRRQARAPLGVRELGKAGIALEPALALRLVALAIDPEATRGERFAVAHAPLAGGPVDAWLRIADGAEPTVVTNEPSEPTRLTLRCTRGALLALIAGVEPPPGEAGSLDGDDIALALVRAWIARTEHLGA